MKTASALEAAAGGAIVLTVNKRLARSLTAAYTERQIARGLAAWETPEILPWDSWLERWWRQSQDASATMLLSAAQEQYVWERVIEDSPDAGRLLHIRPAAQAAMEAWRLVQHWILPATGEEWERSEDCQAFLRWANAFSQTCDQERWLDRARVVSRAIELLRAGCVQAPAYIALEGFDDLTPRQCALLDALRDAGCRIEVGEQPEDPGGDARLVALRDSTEEIETAARWARGLLDAGASGPIGIVAPGLGAIRAKVERIFAEILHPGRPDASPRAFNVSAAPPLLAEPVIQTAFLALELAGGRLPLAEAGSLLRSPFLDGADEEFTARARADAELRKTGEIEVSVAALERLCGACPRLLSSLADWRGEWRVLPREQTPSGWSRSFSKLLGAIGWARGRSLNSTEHQALKAWRRVLSEFSALDACAGSMTHSEARGRLARMTGETAFQPEGESPAPVQILGVLEASGQQFAHLWVLGLHDEAWPPPAKPNPFLPVSLQRDHNLPHATPGRELRYARMITGRLLASAPDVIVSYPQREEDRDLRPSPLVTHVSRASVRVSESPTLLDVVSAAGGLEPKQEPRPAPLDTSGEVRGGTRIFQLQAACPFWAFGEFRLGAKALGAGQFGLGALDRGNLVHRVLELVWKELETYERLASFSADQTAALVHECVETAIEDVRAKRPETLTPRFTELERARLERLVRDWLEKEKSRAPFEVIRREDARSVEIGGIRVRARIDRIDRLADGREVILDYKTGEVETKKWEGPRPDEPQLPVYSITNEAEVGGVLFAQIKAGKIGFKGVARGQGIAPGAEQLADEAWQARMGEWQRALENLARDFRDGAAAPNPKWPGETCKRCGLTALCRARELGQYCLEQEEDAG